MTCNRDYVLIKQGDMGDCFYSILNGSVAIHIQTNMPEEGIPYDLGAQDADADSTESVIDTSGQNGKELDRSIFGNFVGTIPAGRSFGELALINADCVRNASIIADETTDLIVVNRDLYNRSLKAFQEKEFNEKKRFVEEFPLFRGWQTKYRKQLAMSLRKEKANFDGIIIKQGCPTDGICFLLSGQAKILVDPQQHESQYSERFPLPDIAELEKVEARESIRREMNLAVPRTEEKRHIYGPPRTPSFGDRKRTHRTVEVCVIGAVEVIGDLEIAFGLPSYAQTIQCTQAVEMFVLDQKNYERLIEKRNPQSQDAMRDFLHEKLKVRMTWIQPDDLPLLRYFLYKLDEKRRQEENKWREYNRKRDNRETVDFWKSGKLFNGPLIDQYGPGSVFYTIRMRANSKRPPFKAKLGTSGFGITRALPSSRHTNGTGKLSRTTNARGSNLSISAQNGTVSNINGHSDKPGNTTNNKFNSSGSEDETASDSDVDATDGPRVSRSSKVVCDRIKQSSRNTNSNKSGSGCSVDEFMNREMNDLALTRLETRIEEWHTRVNKLEEGRNSRLDKKHMVKLHRYQAENSKKPLPGKKIILKPRSKPKPNALTIHLEAIDNAHRNATPPPDVQEEPSTSSTRDCTRELARVNTTRDTWEETDPPLRHCGIRRPQSCKPVTLTTPVPLNRRPKSARNYTAEEYVSLKEELRRKQIAYKSLLTRPSTSFI
ncbi:hypothetical protein DPMN_011849 [Dreissena polymorpha]|uniref:Cyclic nucleotide-binding domain-containing protein n=2 Tax=Dreissena polymorpha TaxID=45954 RepID=A0A9D4N1B4_DREPO|nr:hypothetical protein DPMN_011849 [Dreissena polymorpha]